jgi:hypothetical protein
VRSETDDDDGLIRLGFGAYAGASLMSKSYGQTASQKRRSATMTTMKIPLNAGFVAEAAARTRYGSASRREDADRATESFRAYLAGLPETRSGGSVSKKNASNHAATRRLSH